MYLIVVGKVPANPQYQKKRRKADLRSKCLCTSVTLLVITALTLMIGYLSRDKLSPYKSLEEEYLVASGTADDI